MIIAFLACVVAVTAGNIIPQIIRFTVDSVFEGKDFPAYLAWLPDREYFVRNLFILALAVGAFAAVQATGSYFQRAYAHKAGEKMSKDMKDKLFSHIQNLPFAWHSSVQTGDIIQRSTQDADLIKRFMSEQFIELLRTVVMVTVGLAVMFTMDWALTLIALGFVPVILIFSAIYYKKISSNFQAADEAEGKLTAVLQENLTGVRIVRAFGAQSRENEKFKEQNTVLYDMWIRLGKHLSVFWASGDLFAALQLLLIMVVGVYFAASGRISSGAMIAFLFHIQMIVWPVRNMGKILGEVSKTGVSAGRINEIFKARPEADAADSFRPEIKGNIAFRDVTFAYGGGAPVLDGVTFDIAAGQTLGILGGTGSGKSTIAYLLNGLYEADGGAIYLDGADVGRIEKAWLRQNVGLILQEPFLFSRTIAENIAIGKPRSGLDEIKEHAAAANVHHSIAGFEKGYDTMVGERGVTLSGGQKQRIAIARTLINKPPVLIFDDSLSAVDTRTDAEIRKSLKRNTKGATAIFISHRITTLMAADKIIVLKDGRVADSGTHKELVSRPGLYKRIYDIQTDAGFMHDIETGAYTENEGRELAEKEKEKEGGV